MSSRTGFVPLSGRDGNSNRVRAQEKLCASPGCHVIGVSHCCIEPNHVVCQRHHRVDTRDSGVIGVMCPDPADAVLAGSRNSLLGAALHHQVPEAIVPVHDGRGAPLALYPDVRAGIETARAQPVRYCGSRKTPCPSPPNKSASTISDATVAASSSGSRSARSTAAMNSRRRWGITLRAPVSIISPTFVRLVRNQNAKSCGEPQPCILGRRPPACIGSIEITMASEAHQRVRIRSVEATRLLPPRDLRL